MMKCEFLISKKRGQESAGILTLDNKGKLSIQIKNGHSILMKEVLADGEAEPDVRVWFNNLPAEYDGSYLRARIL